MMYAATEHTASSHSAPTCAQSDLQDPNRLGTSGCLDAAKNKIDLTGAYTIMTSTWNSIVAESEQNESTRAFNVGIFIPVSAFQMEHLVEICCEDLDLVSDVLDTFCVQGRQRLEAMERVMEHDDLGDIVFEAVR